MAEPAGLIYGRISEVMGRVGAIKKERTNQQQGFKFRGIDDVLNALHPVLSAAKVFIAPEVMDIRREDRETSNGKKMIYTVVHVRHRFWTDDGSFVDAVTVGEGMDSADKSATKAMSAAMKYAVLFTFAIPTEDVEDSDAGGTDLNTGKAEPPKREAKPKAPTAGDMRDGMLAKIVAVESAEGLKALKPELDEIKAKVPAPLWNEIVASVKRRGEQLAAAGGAA